MKRRNFLVGAFAAGAYALTDLPVFIDSSGHLAHASVYLSESLKSTLQLPSLSSVFDAISKVNGSWIRQNPSLGNSDWARATYFSGDMAAYYAAKFGAKSPTIAQNYLNHAHFWAQSNRYSLATEKPNRLGNAHAAGLVYLDLYRIAPHSSDITQIKASIDAIVKSTQNDYWSWVDALNMSMPVFARLGVLFKSPTYYSKMYELYSYTKTTLSLYSTTDHLWFRDQTFLPSSSGKPVYWSRGNGWALAAHAKVLDTLPHSDPHYREYLTTFQQMAATIKSRQRSDGFWNVDLGNPNDFAGPESSGTALFIFGIAWGLNAGLLDRTAYLPVVIKGWNILVNTAIQPDGSLGYVQGSGIGPQSSQPVTASSTADFGVGAFLEAGWQIVQLITAAGHRVTTSTTT